MTNEQAKLIEILLERQREALNVMDAIVETQFILAQALCLEVTIDISGDGGPMNLQ